MKTAKKVQGAKVYKTCLSPLAGELRPVYHFISKYKSGYDYFKPRVDAYDPMRILVFDRHRKLVLEIEILAFFVSRHFHYNLLQLLLDKTLSIHR